MKLLLIALLATSVRSIIPKSPCNRLMIGDKFYDREVIWAHVGRPSNLNVFKPTNTLFFSYSVPESYSDTDFQLAFYNIDTQEYHTVPGIKGGCSVAIDNNSDDIYMGSSDGIYMFNLQTKIADFYKEKDKNIWSLFHKNNLFYISYPDQKLHLEIDGKFAMVQEFEGFEIDHFFISSSNKIYFANRSGLYNYDTDKMKPVLLNELITVRQITEDNEGSVYICTNFGVLIDDSVDGLKKILDYKSIFGLAFDNYNHFIISDENRITRLKLSESTKGCNADNLHW